MAHPTHARAGIFKPPILSFIYLAKVAAGHPAAILLQPPKNHPKMFQILFLSSGSLLLMFSGKMIIKTIAAGEKHMNNAGLLSFLAAMLFLTSGLLLSVFN